MIEMWITGATAIFGLILMFFRIIDKYKNIIKDEETKNLLVTAVSFLFFIMIIAGAFYINNLYKEIHELQKIEADLQTIKSELDDYKKKSIEDSLTVKYYGSVTTCYGDVTLTFNGDTKSSNFGDLQVGGIDLENGSRGYITHKTTPGNFYTFKANGKHYQINILYYQEDDSDSEKKHCTVQVVRSKNPKEVE